MPSIPFSDEDEVIAAANASDYGLAAALWTTNLGRAHHIASRLQAGSVWVRHLPRSGQPTALPQPPPIQLETRTRRLNVLFAMVCDGTFYLNEPDKVIEAA